MDGGPQLRSACLGCSWDRVAVAVFTPSFRIQCQQKPEATERSNYKLSCHPVTEPPPPVPSFEFLLANQHHRLSRRAISDTIIDSDLAVEGGRALLTLLTLLALVARPTEQGEPPWLTQAAESGRSMAGANPGRAEVYGGNISLLRAWLRLTRQSG